ncbi:unnamed protein product [Ceratitis capitata]|uniref:(Mediterranean fruit fly) hypothetical protein n=1 Tax=Ceratitis capitata TaxID=7213 RepID=A0A811V0A9_CERCA|nr:unnamed protein product [Ceratitis capitata]
MSDQLAVEEDLMKDISDELFTEDGPVFKTEKSNPEHEPSSQYNRESCAKSIRYYQKYARELEEENRNLRK